MTQLDRSNLLTDPARAAAAAQLKIPDKVADFLKQISLLESVPFNYLVANELLVPRESIRFFHLDPNWIAALVEGAFSVGRVTEADSVFDQALITQVKDAAAAAISGTVTGLIMRSVAVTGWPNMQLQPMNASGTQLKILRMAHLGNGVLLALFDGQVSTLYVQEPSEGLHFGIYAQERQDTYTKSLKNPDTGAQLTGSVNVPFRPGGKRVIPFNGTGTTMLSNVVAGLASAGFTGPVTSAEFALEMVEGAERVVFQNPTS